MAYCTNCGDEMSEQAVSCPNCGHPVGAEVTSPYAVAIEYAAIGKRFLALLIDTVVLAVVSFTVWRNAGSTLLGFLYHWLLVAFNDGRTLGKMALGIKVARPDGSAVDLAGAAIRSAMSIVSGFVLGIGYLWAFWDPERRTWHDMVANTRVFDAAPAQRVA